MYAIAIIILVIALYYILRRAKKYIKFANFNEECLFFKSESPKKIKYKKRIIVRMK